MFNRSMLVVIWFYFLVIYCQYSQGSTLTFKFEGLSQPETRVCLDLFSESEREFFLDSDKLSVRVVEPSCFEVSSSKPVHQIKDLNPGRYSAAFFEDLKKNGKIDLVSFLGIPIPRSPIGFSQNPIILFGPPSFDATAFLVTEQSQEIVIKMKSLF